MDIMCFLLDNTDVKLIPWPRTFQPLPADLGYTSTHAKMRAATSKMFCYTWSLNFRPNSSVCQIELHPCGASHFDCIFPHPTLKKPHFAGVLCLSSFSGKRLGYNSSCLHLNPCTLQSHHFSSVGHGSVLDNVLFCVPLGCKKINKSELFRPILCMQQMV